MTERDEPLTLALIRASLDAIKAEAHDDEAAHVMEDELHQTVLMAIAVGRCEKPSEAAALALKSREIKFARWCA